MTQNLDPPFALTNRIVTVLEAILTEEEEDEVYRFQFSTPSCGFHDPRAI